LRLISTVFVLLLARTLGAEDFGRYSTAMAYAALCIVFVDLGTNSILTREVARHPEDRVRIADSSHFLKIVASLGSWLILLAVTFLLRFSIEARYLTLCLGIVVIGQTLTEYFCALLSGLEEMGWEAVLKVLARSLGLSLGFAALVMHRPLEVIVTRLAIGTLAGYFASLWLVKRRFRSLGIGIDVAFIRFLVRSSIPLFGSVIFLILYDSQDVLLLNYFHFPQSDIGLFSAAMKIMDVVRVYPVLLIGVFFPTLAKLHVTNAEEFKRKRVRLMTFMTGSMVLVTGFIYALAPWIIRLLYKSEYLPAAHYLQLLAPALFLLGLNFTQIQFLIALNREQKLLKGALLVCLSNLLLAALLIPRFGVAGSCYALVGSELCSFIFLRMTLLSAT
jgi:O-antigen/teichoic acid export membrane protein